MLRSPVLRADWLKPRIKGGIIPFHKRIQQEEKEKRYRQWLGGRHLPSAAQAQLRLPFLRISKEMSKWPAPYDPRAMAGERL